MAPGLSNAAALVVSSAARANRVPPKDRCAEAISKFEEALERGDRGLSVRFKNLRTQSLPDLTNVTRVAEEISNECAARHGGWRKYAMRIVPILDRIRQLAPIGDVLTGGAQNLLVSGVWGAVRLAVESSLTYLSFFEKISDMLLRMGRTTEVHRDFAAIFPQSTELQDMAYEYLTVVVYISTKIVRFAQQSAAWQFASTLLSSVDADFAPLESELITIDLQIVRRAEALAMLKNRDDHALTHRHTKRTVAMISDAAVEAKRRAREALKHRTLMSLCPDQREFDMMYRHQRKRGHSSWLFDEATYKDWASSKTSKSLWLCGKLGSGKSVVMASAIANLILNQGHCSQEAPSTICHFFCASGTPATLKASTILGSIARQALASAPLSSSFDSHLEHVEKTGESLTGDCVDLLVKVAPENWKAFVVIDGLDECARGDAELLLGDLRRLSSLRNILLLCSSRTGWEFYDTATSSLHISSTISLDDVDRSADVDDFISTELKKAQDCRPLPAESEDLIRKQLQIGWDGMFLWLALQMEFITEELRSEAKVVDILGNLPRDLPTTFDRAILRVTDQLVGSKIFALVMAADPAMTLDELRIATSVKPGKLELEPTNLPSLASAFCWHCGGNLLEMDEEDQKVRFIHHSVVLHIWGSAADPRAQLFHFSERDALIRLTEVFVTYLNFPAFERQLSTRPKASQAVEHALKESQAPRIVAESTIPSSRLRTALRFIRGPRKSDDTFSDIQRLHAAVQTAQAPVVAAGVEKLCGYAESNWIKATRLMHEVRHDQVHNFWSRLMRKKLSFLHENAQEHITLSLLNGHNLLLEIFLSDHLGMVTDLLHLNEPQIRTTGSTLVFLVHNILQVPSMQSRIKTPGWVALTNRIFCPNADQRTYFSRASDTALKDVAPYLLRKLINCHDLDIEDFDALIWPMSQHLNLDIPLPSGSRTPLVLAIMQPDPLPKLKTLLQVGADPNGGMIRSTYCTPLFCAAVVGAPRCAQALLDKDADLNIRDLSGSNALIHAVMHRQPSMVTFLMQRGIIYDIRDNDGRTVLHYYAERCDTFEFEDLGLGPTSHTLVDARDKSGLTALHCACAYLKYSWTTPAGYGSFKLCVEALLNAGARTDLEDEKGKTALDLLDEDPAVKESNELYAAADLMRHRQAILPYADQVREELGGHHGNTFTQMSNPKFYELPPWADISPLMRMDVRRFLFATGHELPDVPSNGPHQIPSYP